MDQVKSQGRDPSKDLCPSSFHSSPNSLLCSRRLKSRNRCRNIHLGHMIPPPQVLKVNSLRVFSLGFVIAGRSFLPVGVEKGQSISRLPFWMGIKFYCVLFYLTLIVLTLYLNGIFHHHYSIIVLIADCTALYLPSFECAAKQVIKYAFPSFSYRTTML